MAVVGALLAGVPITPINPKAGTSELKHILSDSDPELVLCPPGTDAPVENRVDVDLDAKGGEIPDEPEPEAPAIVVYTSGTTGPPKGAVLPRRAIASNLDALAEAWEWTGDDVVAHGLPLFHVHGLILGHARPDPARRRRPPPRPLQRRRRGRRPAGRRHDDVRGADDVPPAGHRGGGERRAVPRVRERPAARVRQRRPARDRARADRAADRPADRRALRHDRDADEHRRQGLGRAPPRLRRPAAERRRAAARRRRRRRRSRRPTTRRSARSTSRARTCSSSTSTAPTPRPRR